MIVFLFLMQEQLITLSLYKINWWSILYHSFAEYNMLNVVTKTVLDCEEPHIEVL